MGEIEYSGAGGREIDAIFDKWNWVKREWLHLEDGFTIVAARDEEIVGFISVRWLELHPPLDGVEEGFIDIIEVDRDFRRQGIGARLVEMSEAKCRERGAVQLRAWSADDRTEAIPMWRRLKFGLCPATDYPNGRPVRGYFVAKPVGIDEQQIE